MCMQLYAQRNTYVRTWWLKFVQAILLAFHISADFCKSSGFAPGVKWITHVFCLPLPFLLVRSICSRKASVHQFKILLFFFPKMIWDNPLWSVIEEMFFWTQGMNQQVLTSDPGSLPFAVEFETIWFARLYFDSPCQHCLDLLGAGWEDVTKRYHEGIWCLAGCGTDWTDWNGEARIGIWRNIIRIVCVWLLDVAIASLTIPFWGVTN